MLLALPLPWPRFCASTAVSLVRLVLSLSHAWCGYSTRKWLRRGVTALMATWNWSVFPAGMLQQCPDAALYDGSAATPCTAVVPVSRDHQAVVYSTRLRFSLAAVLGLDFSPHTRLHHKPGHLQSSSNNFLKHVSINVRTKRPTQQCRRHALFEADGPEETDP